MYRISSFPGAGRGPVAGGPLAGTALDHLYLCDWAPACAGEAQIFEVAR